MKKNFVVLAAYALLVSMSVISCSDDDDPMVNLTPEEKPEEVVLKGELTENCLLEEGKSYRLDGGFHVKAGAALTIQPGVNIVAVDDDKVDYILIEQGAVINAQGTATNPIIMTSEKKEPGAWGGLHLCGKAPINIEGGTAKSEIGDAIYGGLDEADNSGVLQYIRLEYTGYAFDEEHEANGVTFYGVGNGTKVDHLQAYQGSDDGFEWFGGTVNVRYMVATNCSDDSFDWTQGWQGKGQFMVAYQADESQLGYDCDCLMECDNLDKNFEATPASAPVLANLTLVGNQSLSNKRGIRLRAGTQVKLYNVLVSGKQNPLTVETLQTENALVEGKSVLEHIWLAGGFSSKEGVYTADMFTAATGNRVDATFTLEDHLFGTEAGGSDMTIVDPFFVKADYKGAVSQTDNWMAGWTK